jgi:hypothetical protein
VAISHRFYSEEEAHQILNLASKDVPIDGMSREELVKAAREMGISVEAIERAEAQVQQQQSERRRAEEDRLLYQKFKHHLRLKFWGSISRHLGEIAFFVGLWYLCGAGYFWPMWVLFFIVLGIISDLADVMFDSTRRQRKFEKWKARSQGASVVNDAFGRNFGLNMKCNSHRREAE